MKTITQYKRPLAFATAAILIFGATHEVQAVDTQAGTTLTTTKTATGFWERTIEYDWTVTKTVNPTGVELGKGESSAPVNYTITTTKTAKPAVDVYGARGKICVYNGGGIATENLTITDNVQAKVGSGAFTTRETTQVSVAAKPVLGPGESYCYDYQVKFNPVLNATYRNEAKVTITNHAGWLPGGQNCPGPAACAFGPQYRVGFILPAEPRFVYKDDSATIADGFIPLDHFTWTLTDTGPWTQSAAGEIKFSATIKDIDADCNTPYTLTNNVSLIESDTLQERNSSAALSISTKACDQPQYSGCTYTQGYWKNHDWPGVVGLYLGTVYYTAEQLHDIYAVPPGGEIGNYLNQLAHQLITAKLNVINGASGGNESYISLADALIGSLVVPPIGSGDLSSEVASGIQDGLTVFNQGGPTAPGNGDYNGDGTQDGPPHCP
jgi:hypothetical protein